MAVTNNVSHKFCEQLLKSGHNVTTATLTVCLMNSAFSFQPATHDFYSDVSASEIAAGFGYLQETTTITTVTVALTGGEALISASNVSWTATGGSIATTGSAIVINSSHASETVVCCIDYGADYVTANNTTFQISFTNGLAKLTPNP